RRRRGERLGGRRHEERLEARLRIRRPLGAPHAMHRTAKVSATWIVALPALLLAAAEPVPAVEPNPVSAIDILLDPDATMVEKAEAANQRLLVEFPKGFALGESHRPHISCLQRYVKTADLAKVYDAVGKVLAEEKPATWKLKAYK